MRALCFFFAGLSLFSVAARSHYPLAANYYYVYRVAASVLFAVCRCYGI